MLEFTLMIKIAIFAFIVSNVLTSQGHILEKYGDFLVYLLDRRLEIIAKPLGYCSLCFSGQLSFWFWLMSNSSRYSADIPRSLFEHITFVTTTIFINYAINRISEIKIR